MQLVVRALAACHFHSCPALDEAYAACPSAWFERGFLVAILRREAVIMMRKLCVVATTVFLVGGDEQSVTLELLVLLGILGGSLYLQMLFRPHNSVLLFRCGNKPA